MTVKNPTSRLIRANRSLPAIVAVGSSLAGLPAAALELGPLTVHSGLGQPLRASIAYVLAPNEQLASNCVALRRGVSRSGLPGIGAATLNVTKGVISLTGGRPVLEPMVSAHIVITCPYAPKFSREFLTFIDPAQTLVYEQAAIWQQTNSAAAPTTMNVPSGHPEGTRHPEGTSQSTIAASPPVREEIDASTSYLVRTGDSVSSIVLRIRNNSVSLWPAVNAIVDANPDAFVNNDPNQLIAGNWINIPSFDGNVAIVADAAPLIVAPTVVEPVAEDPTIVESEVVEPTAIEPVLRAADVHAYDTLAVVETGDTTSDLMPGDIVLDAQLEGLANASSSPSVPTVIITPKADVDKGFAAANWLLWLAGGSIASILGLFIFRRRYRNDDAPVAPVADQPNRPRYGDSRSEETTSVAANGVDFDLTDESPTEENLVLDADLVSGTGLEDSSASAISQDFGFAATTELDIELPFETIAPLSAKTDIMPLVRIDEQSILDSEVMPEEEDDYDMSVIVDATKIPQPEDVTERDLKAVEVAIDDDTVIARDYSINKEVDFQAIEQDYEDEMTATQALNEEIARAATEIALNKDDGGDVSDDDDATVQSPTSVAEQLDITAEMPAENDDDTVEMPSESDKAG